MGNSTILDGMSLDEAVMIGSPKLAVGESPAVIWRREVRATETAAIMFRQLDGEARELDKGIVDDVFLSAGPEGELIAVWGKAGKNGGMQIFACDPSTKSIKPVNLSADRASSPAAAYNYHSEILVVWSRIQGKHQLVEGILGPDWGPVFRFCEQGWNSRPAVCGIHDNYFLAVWDVLAPGGGSIKCLKIDNQGKVAKEASVFPQENPSVRYINPACSPAADGALITAVRVEDVISSHGIVDQYHSIAAAFIHADPWDIGHLESPAQINHGLLSDPDLKSEVWGYLGNRLKPGLLPGGRIWWERKEKYDGLTTRTSGVLCFKDLDLTSYSWSRENILHQGGLAYDTALAADGNSWVVHRPVIQAKTHQLVIEKIAPDEVKRSAFSWLNPSSYSRIELLVKKENRPAGINLSGKDLKLYWGDPHVHSALSLDAEGEPDELLYYARDLAGLDFVALTENDEMYSCRLTRSERLRGCELSEAWTEDGKFVALNGFEYTRPRLNDSPKNHRTVLLPDRSRDFFRWSDPVREDEIGLFKGPDHRELDGLAAEAERLRAILICHHQHWQLSDSTAERGMEAVSGWDTYMHNPENIRRAWNTGRRLCLIGGSDGHRRLAGLGGSCTGVWAEELTQAGILEGFLHGRTIATQGKRPFITFQLCDEAGNCLFIGDYGKLEGSFKVNIKVEVEEGYDDRIELVELLHREKMLANWSSSDTTDSGRRLEVEYEPYSFDSGAKKVNLYLAKPRYLYLRIKQSGPDLQFFSNVAPARGPWAWTTPIWWE